MAYRWTLAGLRGGRINWKDNPKFGWGSLEEIRQGNRVHGSSFLFAKAGDEQGGGVEEDEGPHDDDGLCCDGAYHVEE